MQGFCKPQSSAQARKEAPDFNGVRSIKVMSWFVKPPKRGQYPSINPIYNGLIVYECNRILDSQSGELGLTPSEATNLCFGGENGFITQRYER